MSILESLSQARHQPMPAEQVTKNIFSASYIMDGQVYKIYFPIRDSIKDQLKGRNVFLTCGGDFVEMNQQPGVPYLITKEDVYNSKIMNLIAVSEDDSIPLF